MNLLMNILAICCALVSIVVAVSDTEYDVGAGIWDVTGPASEINMVREL